MSYTFLLEQGEESSAECFSGIPASVLSKSTRTAVAYYSSDSGTGSCLDSPSGTTSGPLTELLGKDASTWSQADSLAPTSPQPEKELESKASNPACGVKWHELSVKYDRDTHTWKTHRCLFDEVLPSYSLTLPKWGSMRHGVLFRRQTPVLHISENGSGYWPTPLTTGLDGGSNSRKAAKDRGMWPTPRASDGEKGSRTREGALKELARGKNCDLPMAAMLWATPTARDWKSGKASEATMARNSRPLSEQVGGSLNPTWVEWLMGWPLEWTDLKPLAMDKFQQWSEMHGDCC